MQATLTTCSMATCSVVLLSILKTAGSLVSEQEEAHFMSGCLGFHQRCTCTHLPGWFCRIVCCRLAWAWALRP